VIIYIGKFSLKKKSMGHKRFTLLHPTKLVRRNLTRLKLSALLLLGLGLTGLQAQTSVNATGGDATGSGGSVSYSVGQVVYSTSTGTSGSVAQGVQQPFEISVETSIEEAKGINLSVKAYPNPTSDYLQLKVESEKLKDLSFQLYDMNGKLLLNEKITGTQTSIVMSNLVPATYFVKVIQGNNEVGAKQLNVVKIFKIVKR
jgi:hypothetical protein